MMRGRLPALPPADHLDSVRLFSLFNAAIMLDVSYHSVYRLVKAGTIATVLVAGKRRIEMSELRAYIDRQRSRGSLRAVRQG